LVKSGEPPSQGVSGKGRTALAFPLLFTIILVTVHVIEPETNFSPISLYSLGPFDILMRTGSLFLGLGFFSMVAGLRGLAKATVLYRVDLILLSIAGAGLFAVGAFNTDVPGTASTFSGLVHSLAANTWSVCALAGILMFGVAFRQNGRSIAIGRLSRNLGIAAMMTYLGGFLELGTYYATVQPRLFFALVVLWMGLVANQLRAGKLAVIAGIHGND
jgi:Protein of unknown function (DUF998)